MNKWHWTYMDTRGQSTQFAMFHNTVNGNLLVSCGTEVILAEFDVMDSKSFSFFFDEELLRIDIIKKGNQYTYNLQSDKEVNTPLNQRRAEEKKERRKTNYLGLIMGFIFIVASGLIVAGVIFLHQNHLKKLRHADGVFTTGTILVTKTAYSFAFSYVYGATNKTIFKNIEYFEERNPISPNGLPFYQNDEFNVLYEKKQPDNHEIQYDNPTDNQIIRYQNRTRNIHLQFNPSITDSLYCDCLTQMAYDLSGLDGYAHFTFQKTPPSKNKEHNIKTYLEFINTTAFREKASLCETDHMSRKAKLEAEQSLVPKIE